MPPGPCGSASVEYADLGLLRRVWRRYSPALRGRAPGEDGEHGGITHPADSADLGLHLTTAAIVAPLATCGPSVEYADLGLHTAKVAPLLTCWLILWTDLRGRAWSMHVVCDPKLHVPQLLRLDFELSLGRASCGFSMSSKQQMMPRLPPRAMYLVWDSFENDIDFVLSPVNG
ncbi:unnamed protein product [Peniophora sp. CBMAI 1063]|nr:unnamed protein product [Peniophora sp. CBMAI 1063]